jgi:hypothetical protein
MKLSLVSTSVIASEHAIMCSLTGFMQNAKGDWDKVADFEYEMFVYLLEKISKWYSFISNGH